MSATTTTPRTVAIFSAMRGLGWQGTAPVDLSNVFEFFNRGVTAHQDAVLEQLDYDIPSLTSDDLVAFIDGVHATWYLCAAHGWNEITDAQAQTYMIRATTDHREHRRGPAFAKVVDGVLEYLGGNGTRVYIGPSGNTAVTFTRAPVDHPDSGSSSAAYVG